MKSSLLIFSTLFYCIACTNQIDGPSYDRMEVETAAREFLDQVHAFRYEAVRASATEDFEILIFGQRLDIDGFEALLSDIEGSRGGDSLDSYELQELNTKIIGNVALTSWSSENWLESAVFVRYGDRWLMNRASVSRRAKPTVKP